MGSEMCIRDRLKMHDCVKKRHDRAKKDRACLVLSTVLAVYVPKKTEPVRYLEQFGRIRSKKDRGCLVFSSTVLYVVQFGCKRVKKPVSNGRKNAQRSRM